MRACGVKRVVSASASAAWKSNALFSSGMLRQATASLSPHARCMSIAPYPDIKTLTGTYRDEIGRNAVRHLRRSGRVPGNVYGGTLGGKTVPVSLDMHMLNLEYSRNGRYFENQVYNLDLGDVTYPVVPRAVDENICAYFIGVSLAPLHAV